ncbi:hypothetical protein XacyCFBP2565_22295 [Xanthomonas arboricola pv. corylina]|nr:hypothetical protein XacyCFBP2565_22295 [Xanthomonas arboricola pv. corylina]
MRRRRGGDPGPVWRAGRGVVKNFFDDSELAHFWLFFTRIPADPRLAATVRDRSVAGWVIDGCRRLHSRGPAGICEKILY